MKRLLKLKKTVENQKLETVTSSFKSILKDKDVNRILFERSKNQFTYQMIVDDDVSESDQIYTICSEIDIFSFNELDKTSPILTLFKLFNSLALNNFFITHILVGSTEKFSTWTTLDKSVLGAKIYENKELPSTTALFCAGDVKNGDIVDIKKVIKVEIP